MAVMFSRVGFCLCASSLVVAVESSGSVRSSHVGFSHVTAVESRFVWSGKVWSWQLCLAMSARVGFSRVKFC